MSIALIVGGVCAVAAACGLLVSGLRAGNQSRSTREATGQSSGDAGYGGGGYSSSGIDSAQTEANCADASSSCDSGGDGGGGGD